MCNHLPSDATYHAHLCALHRAAHLQGAHVLFSFPQNASEEVFDLYLQLAQEVAATCLWLRSPSTLLLAMSCSLAKHCAKHCANHAFTDLQSVANLCTSGVTRSSHPTAPLPLDSLHTLGPSTFHAKRALVCDGAGNVSTADHRHCHNKTVRPLSRLATSIVDYLRRENLLASIFSHLEQALPESPLSPEHGSVITELIRLHLSPQTPSQQAMRVTPGQPFR